MLNDVVHSPERSALCVFPAYYVFDGLLNVRVFVVRLLATASSVGNV